MFYESVGALHMHTLYSDGGGTMEELIAAAREVGLAWIWVTDHDTLEGRNYEGIHDGLVTLVGYEITPRRSHYLVSNIPELISRDLPAAEYVAEVRRLGAVGIVAHPDERAVNKYTDGYRWEDWSIRGFDGVELWNYMSDWIQHYTPRTEYLNYFFPERALRGPTVATVRWWDDLQLEGHHATGVFGVDVHARRVVRRGITFQVYSYAHTFRALVNYLQLDEPLSGEFERAQTQIWDAIRRGRVIMAHNGRGDASGTAFIAAPGPDHPLYTVGDTVPLTPALTLEYLCPLRAEIRLYHDGNLVARDTNTRKLRYHCTTPGHYRVETHRRGKVWIMTNHIHVVVEGASEERRT